MIKQDAVTNLIQVRMKKNTRDVIEMLQTLLIKV